MDSSDMVLGALCRDVAVLKQHVDLQQLRLDALLAPGKPEPKLLVYGCRDFSIRGPVRWNRVPEPQLPYSYVGADVIKDGARVSVRVVYGPRLREAEDHLAKIRDAVVFDE